MDVLSVSSMELAPIALGALRSISIHKIWLLFHIWDLICRGKSTLRSAVGFRVLADFLRYLKVNTLSGFGLPINPPLQPQSRVSPGSPHPRCCPLQSTYPSFHIWPTLACPSRSKIKIRSSAANYFQRFLPRLIILSPAISEQSLDVRG